MTETLIKLKNLHKSFGKNEVLKGINLEIKKRRSCRYHRSFREREIYLLRSMNLLERSDQGKVIFEESILRTRRMTSLPCVRRWAWFSNNLTSFLI